MNDTVITVPAERYEQLLLAERRLSGETHVPREPTAVMSFAAMALMEDCRCAMCGTVSARTIDAKMAARIYRAMLQAALSASQSKPEVP